MNKTVKIALAALMTLVIVAPVFGQDNFPDVPANHWAYSALQRMKQEGILVGYPDGLFRGTRPATRYEMAVAINAAYMNLRNITDGLDSQIKAINDAMKGNTGSGNLDDLRTQVQNLQSQMDAMKNYGQDISDLQKMVDQYSKDLTAMGADVQDMKSHLSDLDKRVTALESHQLPVDVHGEADAAIFGNYSSNDGFGVDVTGRPEGVGRGGYAGAHVGINKDLTVLHEMALQIDSNNQTGPQFHVVGVAGNLLAGGAGTGFGSQGGVASGSAYSEGQSSFYFQKFDVTFAAKAVGLGFNADLGRIGYKISPYIFQRPDTTPYYHNSRWDNGEWAIDGGRVSLAIGKGGLDLFGGRVSDITDNNGTPLQGMTAGTGNVPYTPGGAQPIGLQNTLLPVDQLLGANLNIPLGSSGSLDLSYLFLDSNTIVLNANRMSVYGGTVNFKKDKFALDGGYSKSDAMYNDHSVNDKNDAAYHGNLSYTTDKWGLGAGYKEIEPFYAAPGDWGRIGFWWNPTDIKGWTVDGHLNLSNKLTLKAGGEFYTGTGKVAAGMSTGDKITRETADLLYNVSEGYNIDLGFENVQWDIQGAPAKPDAQWFNIGFGYNFNQNTAINVLWQISNYDSKGVTGFSLFGGQTKAKGGLLTTQVSVKF